MIARFDGDYAAALQMHQEAARLTTNPIFRMRAIRLVALDYASMENYPEAIAQMRAGLATKLQDPQHHAYTDLKIELAELLIDHGDGSRVILDESANLLAEALRKSQELHDVLREVFARRVTASLLAHENKPAAALAEYKQAFALIFKYRNSSANAEFRATSLTQEQPAFRGYFDLVMKDAVARGPAKFHSASQGEESALRLLEQARESHLGAPRTVPMDAATTARVDALLAKMADQSLKIARLLKAQLTKEESAQLEDLQLAMSRARAEVDRERTAAAEKNAGDKVVSAEVRSWRDIAPDAAQLSYALGNDHAYVWARSAAGLRVATLAEDPQTIERELTLLAALDRQNDPAKVERSLAHLSSVLLPAGLLPANSSSVEIVAEGRIASVPFAALHSPPDATQLLAQTHSIRMITTMFTVDTPPRPAQARPFRLVALASGNGTLRSAVQIDPVPRLQAATKEIRAVREPAAKVKLLTGSDGSAAALGGMWSSGVDVVHFATHALADLRQPLASLLVLPAKDAAGSSTYLTAGQVQDWHGDADLVFLSACDSAIGPPRFAAGMPGLQRAFLRAGARGVIATLWPIEDVLAQKFSEDFYQRYTSGVSAVQALSETQRAWLMPVAGTGEAELQRRRMTALAHAYFAQ